MGQRLWYPELLVDEYVPEGRLSPEAWLTFLSDPDENDEDERTLARHYGPGDQIVFRWCENLGYATFCIARDGSLARPVRCPSTIDMFDEAPPPGDGNDVPTHANTFWNDECEAFGDTPETFAAEAAASGVEFDENGLCQVEASMAHWSEDVTFIISPDGKSLLPKKEEPRP